MSVQTYDLLSAADIEGIVSANTDLLTTQYAASGSKLRFTLNVPDSVLAKLSDTFGFAVVNPVPAQIVRGDTASHVDVGTETFRNTHLVYLTDSAGALEISGEEYPIEAGRAYVFAQGLQHGTVGAVGERLSLGPFNELERYVGAVPTYYIYTAGYTPGVYTNSFINICNTSPNFTIVDYSSLAGAVIPDGYTFAGWSTTNPPSTIDYAVGATGLCIDIGFSLFPVFVAAAQCPPPTNPGTRIDSVNTEIKRSRVEITTAPNTLQRDSGSRTERIKARVLAIKCCPGCS